MMSKLDRGISRIQVILKLEFFKEVSEAAVSSCCPIASKLSTELLIRYSSKPVFGSVS